MALPEVASSEQATEFVRELVPLSSAGAEANPRRQRPIEVSLPHLAVSGWRLTLRLRWPRRLASGLLLPE